MAQWMGQFSGHTHATRVEDAETALRHAVSVHWTAASGVERDKKAKAVKHLAKRLLMARLKLMKARIAAVTEIQSGVSLDQRANVLTPLELRYTRMREDGLDVILREFEVQFDKI